MRRSQTSGLPVTFVISFSTRFALASSGPPGQALFSPFTPEKCVVEKLPTFWKYHYRVCPLQMAVSLLRSTKNKQNQYYCFSRLERSSCQNHVSYLSHIAIDQECTVAGELWLSSYISCYISFTKLNFSLIIKTRHPALL